MIRVLHYIGSLKQGGSQAMIMSLYRNIDRSHIQFDFVIHDDSEKTPLALEARDMGAIIYKCPSYKVTTVKKYSDWWKQFFTQHKEYKIVHSHVRSTATIVLQIAKKHGCKTIAHSHSTSSGKGISAFVKNILQYRIRFISDYFMGCSQDAGEWLFGKKICASDRYVNVANSIDVEKYAYNRDITERVRKELGFSNTDIVVGHVGRFAEPKNHGLLVDIFAELHKKNENYKLLLVGDGELRPTIEKKVQTMGLSKYVWFTGERSDVNNLMMSMDIFLFPSLYEGIGIVMIEAQATGCPCIASDGVPKAAKLTDIVDYVGLHEPCETWVQAIIDVETPQRENTYKEIIKAGYDIKESSAWIQNFYMKLEQGN